MNTLALVESLVVNVTIWPHMPIFILMKMALRREMLLGMREEGDHSVLCVLRVDVLGIILFCCECIVKDC